MAPTSYHAVVGDLSPPFELKDQDDAWRTLASFCAGGAVMLVFYPGDFTPVCTKQLCAYQEVYARFTELGVQVVGVSPNSPEEHR